MAQRKFDRQKGCLSNEVIAYRQLDSYQQGISINRVRMINVASGGLTNSIFHTDSKYVARLMLNLGHIVD